jgi:hypothetical protein
MDDVKIEIPDFEPWTKYPALTAERMAIIASLISGVRHEAILVHEPGKGDTNWGLGTRVYERTCFKLQSVAPQYADWLRILPELKGLQFSFAVGNIPFRFYRGAPEEPPDRYNIRTFGELHHLQLCLKLDGLRPPDKVLRFAVETSPATLEVIAVSVVEVDTAGNPVGVYRVPLQQRQERKITILQAKPVELAPPAVEPLTNIEEIAESEMHGTKEELAKAATRSK